MAKNTGKVWEKSGNFVSPEKWEPWPIWKLCRFRFRFCFRTNINEPLYRLSQYLCAQAFHGQTWAEAKKS